MTKTIDWAGVEREYCAGIRGVREISRAFGVSDTAIHKRAKTDGWVRERTPGHVERERAPRVAIAAVQPPAADDDMSERGLKLLDRMLDELDAVTSHHDELDDMICAEESDPKRRRALQRAISLPERANTARLLGAAAKTFREAAAPQGKKAGRQQAAEQVAGKFGVRGPPKLVVDNGAKN